MQLYRETHVVAKSPMLPNDTICSLEQNASASNEDTSRRRATRRSAAEESQAACNYGDVEKKPTLSRQRGTKKTETVGTATSRYTRSTVDTKHGGEEKEPKLSPPRARTSKHDIDDSNDNDMPAWKPTLRSPRRRKHVADATKADNEELESRATRLEVESRLPYEQTNNGGRVVRRRAGIQLGD